MLSWIFLLIALRSAILAWQGQKKTLKIVDAAMGTLSLALFFLLPHDFHWQLFTLMAAIIGFFLYRGLNNPERKFSVQNAIGWGLLYTVGAFAVISCAFFRLTEDKKVAKIILTGKSQPEWISWKNPSNEQAEGTWLTSYEVVIEDLKGKELARQQVYGDLVGLRAEVLTIEWPFHLLGLSNLCHLETLHNGYKTARRHNLFPHVASGLPFSFPVLQALWGKLYHGEWKIPGIKSASLESTYFPLVSADMKPHEGSYWLVAGSSGLTSISIAPN